MKRPRVDVNLEELDQIIERGTHALLSEPESEKLKSALHALAGMLPQPRSTEKTKTVLEPRGTASINMMRKPAPPICRRRSGCYSTNSTASR